SRSRRHQAAASPAMPAPTTTTSTSRDTAGSGVVGVTRAMIAPAATSDTAPATESGVTNRPDAARVETGASDGSGASSASLEEEEESWTARTALPARRAPNRTNYGRPGAAWSAGGPF